MAGDETKLKDSAAADGQLDSGDEQTGSYNDNATRQVRHDALEEIRKSAEHESAPAWIKKLRENVKAEGGAERSATFDEDTDSSNDNATKQVKADALEQIRKSAENESAPDWVKKLRKRVREKRERATQKASETSLPIPADDEDTGAFADNATKQVGGEALENIRKSAQHQSAPAWMKKARQGDDTEGASASHDDVSETHDDGSEPEEDSQAANTFSAAGTLDFSDLGEESEAQETEEASEEVAEQESPAAAEIEGQNEVDDVEVDEENVLVDDDGADMPAPDPVAELSADPSQSDADGQDDDGVEPRDDDAVDDSAPQDQSASVEDQSASLEDQSASLEEQSASLEEQSSSLEEQSSSLEEQSSSLEEQSSSKSGSPVPAIALVIGVVLLGFAGFSWISTPEPAVTNMDIAGPGAAGILALIMGAFIRR